MSARRTRARFRRTPDLLRRTPGGRGAGGSGAGFAGGGPGAPDLNLYALSNFSSANYLATASGNGEAGIVSGFGIATLFQCPVLSAFTTNHPLADRSSGALGWVQYASSSLPSIEFGAANGTAFFSAPNRTLKSSDAGKLFVYVGLYTGAVLRAYLDRVETGSGAGTAMAGYGVAAVPHQLSRSGQFGANSSACPILAHVSFRGVPSLAQIQEFYDRVRALGDLPNSILGATVAHRWSLRDELRGTIVVNSQTGPAQLTDRVTLVGADAMARNGSPTVQVINPAIEGRRTLGAQGFSASNWLQTAPGTGLLGAAGAPYWFAVAVTQNSLTAVPNEGVVSQAAVGGGSGWELNWANTTTLRMLHGGVGFSTGIPFTAGDLGVPMMLLVQYTGTAIRMFSRGVQVGSDSVVGYAPAAGSRLRLGIGYSSAFLSGSISGFEGGLSSLTPGQITQAFSDFAATGTLQPISGATDHRYDLTADTLASGVDAVPATVLDRAGTDNLTRVGIDVRVDSNAIRGIGPYGAADGWQTAPGGGIQGASGGFFFTADVWFTQVPTAVETVAYCAVAGTSGWFLQTVAGGTIRWVLPSGQLSSSYTITIGDLNKRTRFTIHRPASGVMQLFVNSVQAGADTGATVFTANAANAVPFQIGTVSGASNFGSGYVESCSGGLSALTAGELTTLHADLTLPAPVIAGKTTKRYVFEQDIAAASGALPARSVERISGNDDMARVGSPLVLAQRTERLWSYETSPIHYGVDPVSVADFFATAGAPLFPGIAAGHWMALLFMVLSQTGAATRAPMSDVNGAGTAGRLFATSGTNSILTFACAQGNGSSIVSPTATIAAADVGKLQLALGVHDGARVRLYYKRLEASGGTVVTGFTPSTSPLNLLRDARAINAATGLRVLAAAAGHGVPSLSEVQALHDACMAAEDIPLVAIPGKSNFRVSFKLAAGALPATLIDTLGGDNMAPGGTPNFSGQYARAWGW